MNDFEIKVFKGFGITEAEQKANEFIAQCTVDNREVLDIQTSFFNYPGVVHNPCFVLTFKIGPVQTTA
jgi:hypothetical protein